jgi:prepilin-type N-terminal cleavage/methylation domain-containing protein
MQDNTKSGFTLVELLITIIVIGIVFTGLSNIFISIQEAQVQTSYLESATRAAQRQIESLRNSNYNNLTVGQNISFNDQLPSTLPPGSTGNVVVTEPSPGIKRVDVTVSYSYGGKDRDVQLSSLIGVIGIVQ